MGLEKEVDSLTGPEMEVVTVVFHQFETGLREGTIYTRDILNAMKALGLNPAEQEVIDMTNEVANNGLVYFPDFCRIVLRKYREEKQDGFNQQLFKVLCGTDPYPQNFRAKRYRIQEKSFSKAEFANFMRKLPVPVEEREIEEMFSCADRDRDGRISYSEFLVMIDPPKMLPPSKPSLRPSLRPAQRPPRETLTGGGGVEFPPAAAAATSAAATTAAATHQKAKGPQLAKTALTAMTAVKAMKAMSAAGQQQQAAAVAAPAAAQLPEQLAAVSIAEPATDKPVIVNSSAV